MPVRRLYVICEGKTEEVFVGSLLSTRFRSTVAVETTALLLPTKLKMAERTHKGGWVSYATGKKYIEAILTQKHADDVWITTMLDLYAIPNDFPALQTSPSAPPERCVEALEAALAADITTDRLWRFTPYLQLHEFEALLLTDIDAIGRALTPDTGTGAFGLKADVSALSPEEVDQGRSSAPSKRIIRHFPSYEGQKATAGPLIAADIGLSRPRAACPHFDGLLTTLEARCRE